MKGRVSLRAHIFDLVGLWHGAGGGYSGRGGSCGLLEGKDKGHQDKCLNEHADLYVHSYKGDTVPVQARLSARLGGRSGASCRSIARGMKAAAVFKRTR